MSTNEPDSNPAPKGETIRISLDPEPGVAPPVPQSAAPQRSSGGLGVVLAIVGAVFALGGVGFAMLVCTGVAFFLFSADKSAAEYEAQTVYSPPVDYETPYGDASFESSSYAFEGSATPYGDYGSTSYDPYASSPAPVEYAPIAETTYAAPTFDGSTRAAELESAIAADEQLLADLDAQLALTGIFGGLGAIAAEQGQTVDDQAGGVILGAGANAVAQQLQSERDAVAIRLNANRTALAELRAAGY